MFEWEKLGRIFHPGKQLQDSWMKEYAQAPSIAIFEDRIRIFFSSRAPMDKNGMYITRLGFIDVDRRDLFKIIDHSKEPILPLGGLGAFDEFGTYPASILDLGKELKVYYAGWTRCESVPFNAAIGLANSFDGGKTFQKVGQGPVLSFTPDEPFVLGSPKIRHFEGKYYLWYSAGRKWIHNQGQPQPVYKIRMAYSDDGMNWTRQGKNILPDVLEENECQASPDVFFMDGRYHMWFSYRYNLGYREKNRGYRIGYAYSEDLHNWTRKDELAGIDMSEDGWDSESLSYPFVFRLDGKVYMLYQGNEIGKNGFGLALLKN